MSYFYSHLTRENIVQLSTAYLGLLSTYTKSAIGYVFRGPGNAAWDFRTHYIRDLLVYMFVHKADVGIQLLVKLTNSGAWPELTPSMQRVPQGFASRFLIPSYPLGTVAPSVWLAELEDIARLSQGRQMHGECILAHTNAASSAPLLANYTTGGGRNPRAILHFHGGAYVSGTLEQYRPVHLSGLRVYGFAYRLAPHS
ncbi:hypothetical protein GGI21_006173, partial [Coemansia aciculifera]